MLAVLVICFALYLIGGGFWFMVYYTEWSYEKDSSYCDPVKRQYYASQLLATPLWPAALFRNLMFVIGKVKEDTE